MAPRDAEIKSQTPSSQVQAFSHLAINSKTLFFMQYVEICANFHLYLCCSNNNCNMLQLKDREGSFLV